MPDLIRIFEVGPRDGLQNEKVLIPASDKIELVDMLSNCGFDRIEVTAFVSPKWVPQMADNAEVMAGITRNPEISYAVLTPNLKGYEMAKTAKADEVAIFASASEGFSRANVNCSITESLERFAPIVAAAAVDGIPVRGYVSCVTDCPFDGPTPPDMVARSVAYLRDAGCYEVSLGETIGYGTPKSIDKMLTAVLNEMPPGKLAGHYHDTSGRALDNIKVSIERGLRVFDASVGGLGGCPYAPGAAGNVDTIRVAELANQLGYQTGLNLDLLEKAAEFAISLRNRPVQQMET
ncbi:MAG: hydroxymethylglutaryl-CoA lyase [Salaquimonas sp.]